MITATRKALALFPAFLGLAIGILGCAVAPQEDSDGTSADAVSGAVGNWSGMTAGQCVHGVYSFYANRFGISLEGTGAQGGNIGNCEFEGACMIWKSARVEPTEVAATREKFNKYDWGTTMPQTYDIVVYPPRTAGLGPGHVAAVDHIASKNPADWEALYVMDSNYYGGERLATAVHTVSRAPYGIFRLKSLDHATTPTPPKDIAPKGYVDSATCAGISGWAQDTTSPTASIFTDVYFNGPAGSVDATGVRLTANGSRSDLCTTLGSCDHAWSTGIPRSQLTNTAHAVYAYGIDTTGGSNTLLTNSGKTFSCAAPEIDASTVKRLITTSAVTTSWNFSTFYDSAPYPSATLATVKDGPDFVAAPELVQMSGDADIFVVDGNATRKITSMASFAAWRFTTEMIKPITKPAYDALDEGLAWPVAPLLANDSDDARLTSYYVLDDSVPVSDSEAPSAPPSTLASGRNITALAPPTSLASGNVPAATTDPNAAGDDPGGAPAASENGDNGGASSSGCSVTRPASSKDRAIWAFLPLAALFVRRRRRQTLAKI